MHVLIYTYNVHVIADLDRSICIVNCNLCPYLVLCVTIY